MIKEAIKTAVEGNDLSFDTARAAMDEIMRGEASPAQIAAFLTALRMKGESVDEITACASVMREKCTRLPFEQEVMDIVGTGGDCANTFNISTVTSFVVASAGVPVAKHGNRSVSSKCGRCRRSGGAGSQARPSRLSKAEGCWSRRACASCSPPTTTPL